MPDNAHRDATQPSWADDARQGVVEADERSLLSAGHRQEFDRTRIRARPSRIGSTATSICRTRRTRVPSFRPSSRQHGCALSNWDLLSLTISLSWQPARAANRPLSVHRRRLATGSCSAERSDSRYATVIDPTGRATDAVGRRVGTHVEGRSEFGCGQASVNAPTGNGMFGRKFLQIGASQRLPTRPGSRVADPSHVPRRPLAGGGRHRC